MGAIVRDKPVHDKLDEFSKQVGVFASFMRFLALQKSFKQLSETSKLKVS